MSSSFRLVSSWVELPSRGKKLHIISSAEHWPSTKGFNTSLILLHGLGSSSSAWITSLLTEEGKNIISTRDVIAYDFDGHGLSEWSGRNELSMQGLTDDLKELLDVMKVSKVLIGAHSMSAVRFKIALD